MLLSLDHVLSSEHLIRNESEKCGMTSCVGCLLLLPGQYLRDTLLRNSLSFRTDTWGPMNIQVDQELKSHVTTCREVDFEGETGSRWAGRWFQFCIRLGQNRWVHNWSVRCYCIICIKQDILIIQNISHERWWQWKLFEDAQKRERSWAQQ